MTSGGQHNLIDFCVLDTETRLERQEPRHVREARDTFLDGIALLAPHEVDER